MNAVMPTKIKDHMKQRFKKYNTSSIDKTITMSSVFDKYDGICQGCGVETKYEHPPKPYSSSIEHIVPLSKGGTHTWDNIELLCYGCNTTRNNCSGKIITTRLVKTFRIFGYTINITKGN